jgi:hypothetical protein
VKSAGLRNSTVERNSTEEKNSDPLEEYNACKQNAISVTKDSAYNSLIVIPGVFAAWSLGVVQSEDLLQDSKAQRLEDSMLEPIKEKLKDGNTAATNR